MAGYRPTQSTHIDVKKHVTCDADSAGWTGAIYGI